MAIPTRIEFKDFYKAVQLIAVKKELVCRPYKGKKGSAVCFEFFKPGEDKLFDVFCVHEDRKKRVVWSDDLKKACKSLGVTKEEFEEFVENEL